jgi:hypothetical protein
VSRGLFIVQGRERRGYGRAGTASNEGAAKWPLSWSFILLLMGFDGEKMARPYWMVYDHEMMNYCGIFKGLVS